jgi:hypothetical protein
MGPQVLSRRLEQEDRVCHDGLTILSRRSNERPQIGDLCSLESSRKRTKRHKTLDQTHADDKELDLDNGGLHGKLVKLRYELEKKRVATWVAQPMFGPVECEQGDCPEQRRHM